MDLESPRETLDQLKAYARMVIAWNRKSSNLISKNDESRVASRHIFESLAPTKFISSHCGTGQPVINVVDVGSGAGFPAIPLAIVRAGMNWTLVESRRPKVLFVRRAVQDLGLANVSVIHSRFELLSPDLTFDAVTSRATMSIPDTLSIAARFVRPGGLAFLWKGERWESEAARLGGDDPWLAGPREPIPGGPTSVVMFSRQ